MSEWNLDSLLQYTKVDTEKKILIEKLVTRDVLTERSFKTLESHNVVCNESMMRYDAVSVKVCPECGKKYPHYENFCFECEVKLRDFEKINVKNITVGHEFKFEGLNDFKSFDEVFTGDNLVKVNDFNFKKADFNRIVKNIKSASIRNLDAAIKQNEIDLDDLSILEKITLFVKSFADVDYKSYGGELGYYNFNRIFVDDRQLDSMQITTMLHELTHFLIKEILTQILCRLLDCSKSREIESIITFILSYSDENCLIDEYAAHTVEGRFTLFGYQDYSSFLNIERSIDRPADEIEMLKTIGNTFANVVKGIVASFIDDELLREIKTQFKMDVLDDPDYTQLKNENCTLLNDEGFFTILQFILLEGFTAASENTQKLEKINEMW